MTTSRWVLAAVLAALTLLQTSSATAQVSPRAGDLVGKERIVVDLSCGESTEIYVMDSNGSNTRRLTNEAARGAWAAQPKWSPDGSSIAFTLIWHKDDQHRSEVYLMGSRGDGLRPLTRTPDEKSSWNVNWSPDGRQIAFASDRHGNHDVYTVQTNGRGLRQITRTPGLDRHSWNPAWSPDGKQIAFNSNRDGHEGIYVVELATLKVRALTETPDGKESWTPAWSPDGREIAFASNRDGPDEIYVMNASGSNVRRMHVEAPGRPRWSPDGSKLIFHRPETHAAIWVVSIDGTGLTQLTATDCSGRHPDWCCVNAGRR